MSKFKVFVVLIVMIAIASPLFAAISGQDFKVGTSGSLEKTEAATTSTASENRIPVSIIAKGILIILAIGGAILLFKGSWELVHALTHQADDPRGVTKAVVNMVLGLVILLGFFGLMFYVFPNAQAGTGLSTGDSYGSVLTGITGALVELDPTVAALLL